MTRHFLTTWSFSSNTSLKIKPYAWRWNRPLSCAKITYWLIQSEARCYPDVLVIREVWHVFSNMPSISPPSHRSDTPARTNRDSRNYTDNRRNLSHWKVQFLSRSRERPRASFHYSRDVSHDISRSRQIDTAELSRCASRKTDVIYTAFQSEKYLEINWRINRNQYWEFCNTLCCITQYWVLINSIRNPLRSHIEMDFM